MKSVKFNEENKCFTMSHTQKCFDEASLSRIVNSKSFNPSLLNAFVRIFSLLKSSFLLSMKTTESY